MVNLDFLGPIQQNYCLFFLCFLHYFTFSVSNLKFNDQKVFSKLFIYISVCVCACIIYKEPCYTGLRLNGKIMLTFFFKFYRNMERTNSQSEK